MRERPTTLMIPRHHRGTPGVVEGISSDLRAEFARHQRRACLAGALCLALAQLSALGRLGEAAIVLELAADLAEKWERAANLGSAVQSSIKVPPRQKSEFLAAFDIYRSVSHLWAAAVYGRIQYHEDVVPMALHAVPRFMAYANEIARLSTSLPWSEPRPELELPTASLWFIVLPAALVRKAEAEIRQENKRLPAQHEMTHHGKAIDVQT